MYGVYLIEDFDTIDTIARKFNAPRELIERLNPGNSFTPGNKIVVPTISNYFDIYTIEKGDSLYDIARKFNTDYNLLAILNGMNTADYIYPGETILVPKRDVKYYLTKEGDTLLSVNRLLNGDLNTLLSENNNIYLKEGQLMVYKG